MRKQIFISDLDGTLLKNDATLSHYSRSNLELLLAQDIAITIATARSITSVREILGDLPIRLPVVCANGAYVADLETGIHHFTQSINKPADGLILEMIEYYGLSPFITSYDGKKDHLYYNRICNEAMWWYEQDRLQANDARLKRLFTLSRAIDEDIICFNVMGRKEQLLPLEYELEKLFGNEVALYFYENWLDGDWYWLSIFDKQATKANAIQKLIQQLSYELSHLTVFGDNHNDLSMFHLGANRVAPANAVPEIKALASHIIGTNETDSVVNYLLKATDQV